MPFERFGFVALCRIGLEVDKEGMKWDDVSLFKVQRTSTRIFYCGNETWSEN